MTVWHRTVLYTFGSLKLQWVITLFNLSFLAPWVVTWSKAKLTRQIRLRHRHLEAKVEFRGDLVETDSTNHQSEFDLRTDGDEEIPPRRHPGQGQGHPTLVKIRIVFHWVKEAKRVKSWVKVVRKKKFRISIRMENGKWLWMRIWPLGNGNRRGRPGLPVRKVKKGQRSSRSSCPVWMISFWTTISKSQIWVGKVCISSELARIWRKGNFSTNYKLKYLAFYASKSIYFEI